LHEDIGNVNHSRNIQSLNFNMKRLALLAVLTISLISAVSSCKKKSCYQCTTTITESIDSVPPVSYTAKKDYCDITDDKAREIEDAGTKTTVNTVNGVVMTTVNVTVCK
jgi:ferredoxin